MEKISLLDINSIDKNKSQWTQKYWEHRLRDVNIERYFDSFLEEDEVLASYSEVSLDFLKESYDSLHVLARSKQAKHIVLLAVLGAMAHKYAALDDIVLFTTSMQSEATSDNTHQVFPIRISNFETVDFKTLLNQLKTSFIDDVNNFDPLLYKVLKEQQADLAKLPVIAVTLEETNNKVSWEPLSPDMIFCFNVTDSPSLTIKYKENRYKNGYVKNLAQNYFKFLSILTNRDSFEVPLASFNALSEIRKDIGKDFILCLPLKKGCFS